MSVLALSRRLFIDVPLQPPPHQQGKDSLPADMDFVSHETIRTCIYVVYISDTKYFTLFKKQANGLYVSASTSGFSHGINYL